MTTSDRLAALIAAVVFYLASVVVFCVGAWAGWEGNYARGAFFLVLALCFDNYGDYNSKRAAQ